MRDIYSRTRKAFDVERATREKSTERKGLCFEILIQASAGHGHWAKIFL